MLPQDYCDQGSLSTDRQRTVIQVCDVYESSFGIVKTDIQIEGWQNNKRFRNALLEIFDLAFIDDVNVTEIIIKTSQ